jgi:TPR repeat protein
MLPHTKSTRCWVDPDDFPIHSSGDGYTAGSGTPISITALKNRAESGDVEAQVEIGTAYASGYGVSANEAEAVKWFRKAAHPSARF